MVVDETTFSDLSIFNAEDDYSLFSRFDLTRTTGGRDRLRQIFRRPLRSIEEIADVQKILTLFIEKEASWPATISNGSVMMIYKFYETAVDTIPSMPTVFSAYMYKALHGPDYGLVKYSAQHTYTFIKSFDEIIQRFENEKAPDALLRLLKRAKQILDKPQLRIVFDTSGFETLSDSRMLGFAAFVRYHFKHLMYELIEIYSWLDAWFGMAMATKKFGLTFPQFIESEEPIFDVHRLYHPLVPGAVPYDVTLNDEKNFIFLTGANMAGKSTFIKSVGIALFLAHTGMGVPAARMRVSVFGGLLTNINVRDNIVRGESFFYNEVMRIKDTIFKVTDQKKWLVLIDELFKGTNIQDAMKCSLAVIKGLVKVRHSLFVLSTHLYEIGEELEGHGNIDFKYFETEVAGDDLKFNYQLSDGISNDRLGFFILQKEKVTDMLDQI